MIAVVDGLLGPADAACIPALDRGAWYGDAVFETFRTFDGRVLALDARLARLERSARVLGFALPPSARFVDDLARAIDAFRATGQGDAYVRVACSRGAGRGGLLPPLASEPGSPVPLRTVFVGPIPVFPARYGTTGLSVVTSLGAGGPGARAASAKVAAYVEPMLAIEAARGAGADDAIVLDRDGAVLEGATSNVFVWDGRRLLSPPASMGLLEGITAALVGSLGVTHALGGVVRRVVSVHALYEAEEVFLTSSVRGVVGVGSIDGRLVGSGGVGPITRRVAAAYAALASVEARGVDAQPDSR